MTRRTFLAAPFIGSLAAATRYRDYARCLPDYLPPLPTPAYKHGKAPIANPTTPEPTPPRQHWVRETFWQLTGGKPERTPLNLRKTGEFARANYSVERLIYESQPGLM